MENTIVSYKTALLAKEKGFNDTIGLFKGKHIYNYKGELDGDCSEYLIQKIINSNKEYLIDNKENISAPTQSLLQKWLRVKYNYNINIKHITHNQKYGFSVTGNYDEKTGGIIIPYNFKGYDSYEECLEDALQQCLNIIKNDINNRQNSSK